METPERLDKAPGGAGAWKDDCDERLLIRGPTTDFTKARNGILPVQRKHSLL